MSPVPYRPRWRGTLVTDPAEFDPAEFDPAEFRTVDEVLRFASAPLDDDVVPYRGLLASDIAITKRLGDPLTRMVEVQRASLALANADGALTALVSQKDLRGAALALERYDVSDGFVFSRFVGQVSQPGLAGETLTLEAMNVKFGVLEQSIPTLFVNTLTFPNAVDLGKTVPILFGTATDVPLPCINDDKMLNQYDYLCPLAAGGGAITVNAVRRDGVGGQTFASIHASEYTVSTTLYPGFTVLRFPVRQERFGGTTLHSLYGDFTGPAVDRNFARARRNVLSSAVWGCGEPVNAASFNAAEADPSLATLFCDGVLLAPTPALEVLRLLGMVRGLLLDANAAGEWTERVDTYTPAVQLTLNDGTGDGPRNIVSCDRRLLTATENMTRSLILKYRRDPFDGTYRCPQSRGVSARGKDLIIEHPYIRDHETADRVVDYLSKRLVFQDQTAQVSGLQDARARVVGDVVRLTYAPRGYAGAVLEIAEVTDRLTQLDLVLRGGTQAQYDAIYSYAPGTFPVDNAVDFAVDYSRTAPAAASALSIASSGTALGSDGTTTAYFNVQFTTPTVNYSQALVGVKLAGTTQNTWFPTRASGVGVVVNVSGLVPGRLYDIIVQTVNALGSLPSLPGTDPALANVLAPGDATAPGVPTGLAVSDQKLTTVTFVWTVPADKDVRGYNWDLRTASNGGGSVVKANYHEGATLTLDAATVGYGAARHFRVQAVDFTGNVGAFTSSVSVTFSAAVTADIGNLQITTAKRQPLGSISIAYSLVAGPAVTNATYSHGLGVIPNITPDSGNGSVIFSPTQLTTASFLAVLLNPLSGSGQSGTAIGYFW